MTPGGCLGPSLGVAPPAPPGRCEHFGPGGRSTYGCTQRLRPKKSSFLLPQPFFTRVYRSPHRRAIAEPPLARPGDSLMMPPCGSPDTFGGSSLTPHPAVFIVHRPHVVFQRETLRNARWRVSEDGGLKDAVRATVTFSSRRRIASSCGPPRAGTPQLGGNRVGLRFLPSPVTQEISFLRIFAQNFPCQNRTDSSIVL